MSLEYTPSPRVLCHHKPRLGRGFADRRHVILQADGITDRNQLVSRTSSQVVVWLMMQSLSENVLRGVADEMNARPSQKTRASTTRLTFFRMSSSRSAFVGLIRKHTTPSAMRRGLLQDIPMERIPTEIESLTL